MRYFRRRPRVDRKPDRSFVTQADTASELELRKRIEKKYPTHGVLAEEYGDRTSDKEIRWIIDPIDATHSYLRGVPAFATLIALERAGVLEGGVMSAPLILVEEAGGRLTDFKGQRTYAGGNAVASNGLVHEIILEKLNGA